MRFRYVLPVLIVAWLLTPVYAEFYRYTDANGVVRYTDNIADVPESQRAKIDSYEEVKEDRPPLAKPPEAVPETHLQESDRKAAPNAKASKKTAAGLDQRRALAEEFNRIDAGLVKEYSDLMKERATLEKEKGSLKTSRQINAYRVKVTDYNQRLADYEKRRKELQDRIDAFNAEVGQ